jgi:outer membrane protein OmpA-like peptidoglycan-associated protein
MRPLAFFFLLSAVSLHAQVPYDRLGRAINSPLDEQNPVLSPDGRQVYFTVSNHERNVGGKADKGDIWVTEWVDSLWSTPRPIGILSNGYHNAVAGFSSDQKSLYLWGHYDKSSVLSQGISKTTNGSGDWKYPVNVVVPYFLNRSVYYSGMMYSLENILVFGADGFGTVGAEDLYVSFRKPDGAWTEPKNLGRQINTAAQDVSPALSADGKRLYFSTNGRKGLGSFDVYYADRLDDTWTNWSEPVNLGDEVNTPGRELFYRPYSQWGVALYTSTQNSDGYGDIRVQKLSREEPVIETPAVILEVSNPVTIPTSKEEPVPTALNRIQIFGTIMSSKDNSAIQGKVEFKADSVFQVSTAQGGYQLVLSSSKEYAVKVEAEGFIGKTERLDLRTFQLKRVELNFSLQPAEVGVTVNLKNVLFQQSTANLLPESFPELDVVYDMMKANPNMQIFLGGHTDNRGQHYLNVRLSQSRVEAVKDYLVKRGIESARITGQGFGGIRPIADNDAEETRKLNRRVEFTITKK